MEPSFEIKELTRLPVLSIHSVVQPEALNEFLVRSCTEIFGYLGRLGVQPVGPPFVIYFNLTGQEGIDLEVCVPTPELLTGEGTIASIMLAEGEFASIVQVGPPGQITNACRSLISWASDRGYWPSGPVREVRLGSFGKADEPLEDITEILVPMEKVA